MLMRSPIEIEMYIEMQAEERERALRNRRPEWFGNRTPVEGASLRRGVGRWFISAGTWISGSRDN